MTLVEHDAPPRHAVQPTPAAPPPAAAAAAATPEAPPSSDYLSVLEAAISPDALAPLSMADMLEPLRSAPLEAPATAADDDDDDDDELAAADEAAAAADEDSTRDEDPARSATPDWLKDAGAALGLPG